MRTVYCQYRYNFDKYSIYNILVKCGALWPLLFNIPLEYAIRKAQLNQLELKLNKTVHFLVHADDINLFVDNIHTIDENIEKCCTLL
jgi:hypothetical protein